MPYTFNDMTFLTAPQRQAAQQLSDLGQTVKNSKRWVKIGGVIQTPLPGVTPPLTLSNTKRAQEIYKDLLNLWRLTSIGIDYSDNYYRYQNLQALDASNP